MVSRETFGSPNRYSHRQRPIREPSDTVSRLFHVEQDHSAEGDYRRAQVRRPRRPWLMALLVMTLPLLAACSLTDSPDGWAAPTTSPHDEDVVLLSAGDGHIVAYDFTTSREQWRFPDQNDSFIGLDDTVDPGAFYSNPAFVAAGSENEEIVVATYNDGIIFAIRTDGSGARELFHANARLVAGIVVDDTTAYVATTDKHVYAINIEDPPASSSPDARGLLWDFHGLSKEVWGTPALAETVAHGKILLVPGMDGTLYALRATDGDIAWKLDTDAAIATNILVAGGRAYIGGFDRAFRAIDLETGDMDWEQTGNDWFWTTPLLVEGVIYVADLSGALWAWSADTGDDIWAAPYNANRRRPRQGHPQYGRHRTHPGHPQRSGPRRGPPQRRQDLGVIGFRSAHSRQRSGRPAPTRRGRLHQQRRRRRVRGSSGAPQIPPHLPGAQCLDHPGHRAFQGAGRRD